MKQGWDLKKLSDTGKIFNGNSINEKFKKDNYIGLNDGYPFIATKDIGFDNEIDYDNGVKIPFTEKAKYKIAPSNIPLICAEGGSAGRKIGFTNQDVCFGNKLFAFVPNKNIESKFIYYYYFHSSFQKYFRTEMTGIIGGISVNKFKEIEIPIPPLQEQQRIVSILDDAFAKIDKAKANAEQNLKNAKELFESYLQGVFEDKGDDWEEKRIDEICKLINGRAYKKDELLNNGKYRVLRVGNFFTSDHWYYSDLELDKDKFCDKEDLLYAWSASFGPRIWKEEKVIYHYHIWKVIPDEILVTRDFLFTLFEWDKEKIKAEQGTGTTMMHVSKGSMENRIVPVPPLKVQKTILRQLDALRAETKKLEAVYQKKIKDLEELKKSILQRAFSGKL